MGLNFNEELNVDKTSLKILSLLQKNARISNSEIGRMVGLSSPAVNERIKKMEKSGLIKNYSVEIDHKKLGFEIEAFINVNLAGIFGPKLKETAKSFRNIPEVLEFYNITGSDDIVMKVVAKSIEHLRIVISRVAPLGQMYTRIIVTEFKKRNSIDIDLLDQLSSDEKYFDV